MNPRVVDVQYQSPYKLIITFKSNEVKEFDIAPYLQYPVYSILKDESYCKKVRAVLGTVAWDDEVDFDPDTLYLESREVVSKN